MHGQQWSEEQAQALCPVKAMYRLFTSLEVRDILKHMKEADMKGGFWSKCGSSPGRIGGVYAKLSRNALRNVVMKIVRDAGMGEMTTNEDGGSAEPQDK